MSDDNAKYIEIGGLTYLVPTFVAEEFAALSHKLIIMEDALAAVTRERDEARQLYAYYEKLSVAEEAEKNAAIDDALKAEARCDGLRNERDKALRDGFSARDLGLKTIEMLVARERDEAREAVAQWMIAHSYATGHGDTIQDLLGELEAQIDERRDDALKAEARCDGLRNERDKALRDGFSARDSALEEAAKVAEKWPAGSLYYPTIATAIKALKNG
jgi:hypothetical protein